MIDLPNKLFTLLGDSWNYMPPILVPSSTKRIGAHILVIAKLNEMEDFWEVVLLIWSFSGSSCLLKACNRSTRTRCENSLRLRIKTLWCRLGVFIVNSEHISHFVLIADFEQANFGWSIFKRQTLLKKRSGISCIML